MPGAFRALRTWIHLQFDPTIVRGSLEVLGSGLNCSESAANLVEIDG